ncbi:MULTISPECIES: DUF4229 domain-containing protein [unclassified Nocardioides]|uniref:DUF4229 domain-containing protein n=1 Tax=unclassified Nocardioides TaxID=2615069 RepID=UPI0006F2810C|nr:MULTISPECIES: DUF4229 domain-containing protein [unclassified Nocardioides]KRA30062.1 hypothetical protein ASD81_20455 [Nocardioides sp. Root614]KRA86982.1 hypothetical protein ASD84_22670 [Nocardioides sp. Root682]
MKEFWIYTGLRVGLFIAAFCTIFGVWFLVADSVNVLLVVVFAFLVSGIASYVLLAPQRNAFAHRVEGRADRIVEKFDEMKAKEDDAD